MNRDNISALVMTPTLSVPFIMLKMEKSQGRKMKLRRKNKWKQRRIKVLNLQQ